MIRDDACTRCRLGVAATSSVDVCLPGVGRGGGVMVVSRLPLGTKRRAEMDDYLREADVDPSSVFYTAASRCRVWDVEPTKTDVKACRPYLEQEIADQQPRVIIALGNEALLSLTGHSGIMKYRGREIPAHGSIVLPTVSPAMVNRNPGQRAGLIADLRAAGRVADGSDAPTPPPPKVLGAYTGTGLRALSERLRTCEGAYLDIETNGFDEFRPDSLVLTLSITLWDEGDTAPREVWGIPLAHPESPWLDKWRKVLAALWRSLKGVKKVVAHNGKFDLRWLHQFGMPVDLTFDTMLAAHLLDENRPKGLKPLAQSMLGVPAWAISTKALVEEPLGRVLRYNCLDTWYGAYLYFLLRSQLAEQPRLVKIMRRMMMPASNAFVEIERRGIWTDREQLHTQAAVSRAELAAIDAKLEEQVPPREVWPANVRAVNFNPSNFAKWWLFEHRGYPVLARGKDKEDGSPGDPSMAEAVMLKLQADAPDDEVLRLMIERTKWQKYSTAFFGAYEEQIDNDDRIHTTFKLTGTVTGRLSSGKNDADKVTGRVQNRGVNLQQVPRDGFVRGIFGAPPGSVFVECDYSQIELRVAAFLARERHLLHLYATGQDVHMTMAMRMTGKAEADVTKEERKKAKAVNFGFLFGMGWAKFIDTAWSNYGVVVDEGEAKAFRRAFFEEFPELPRWHARQRQLAKKYKRVESPLGRVRHLPDIDSPVDGVRAEAERQAINSPVQATASDMCLYSLVLLTEQFRRYDLKARSVGTVHDAINFEVPVAEVPTVLPMIRRTMETLPLEQFGCHMDVPIIADAKIGTRWGSALEVPELVSSSPVALEEWMREHSEALGLGLAA